MRSRWCSMRRSTSPAAGRHAHDTDRHCADRARAARPALRGALLGQDSLNSPAEGRVALFNHNHDVAIYRDGRLVVFGLGKSADTLHYDPAADRYTPTARDRSSSGLASPISRPPTISSRAATTFLRRRTAASLHGLEAGSADVPFEPSARLRCRLWRRISESSACRRGSDGRTGSKRECRLPGHCRSRGAGLSDWFDRRAAAPNLRSTIMGPSHRPFIVSPISSTSIRATP